MKMHSDLGKMYRRNYMVKSQLRSLEEKSKALNAKIDGETKIDEWAESYITRADAQIDDVSDYMNYRNLGQLAHVRRPGPPTKALPAPALPIYGQQRVAADETPNADALAGFSDMVPLVTWGNTLGVTLGLAAMGGVYGLVTYSERKSSGTVKQFFKTRGKHAAITAGWAAAAALAWQGVMGAGQKTGKWG